MKKVIYYSNSCNINNYYYRRKLDFDDIDEICRKRLFPFEIDYITDKLNTDNFKILYFYSIDDNHKVVHLVNLNLYDKNKYEECFISLPLPYLKLFYKEEPYKLSELVYVYQRQDKTTYEKVAPISRPKVDRYNHYQELEVGFINKYGHKLIKIYERVSINNIDSYRSITGAGLVLDK